MNHIVLAVSRKLNHSVIVRTILKPVIDIKRKVEKNRFQKSEDAEFIRTFKKKHLGERCFIIGNGPSLTGKDLDLIKGEVTFACNRIYNIYDKTDWRPTYYMCGDRQCLLDEIANIKNLKDSVKFVATSAKKYGRKPEDKLHYFLLSDPFEPRVEKKIMRTVSEDVSRNFSAAQTITCSEIEFAIYMGFREIILLGVDHNYPIVIDKNGKKTVNPSVKSHFEGGGSKESSLHYIYYDAATESYKNIEKYAQKHGIKIYNASRNTKLEAFERKNLEGLLRDK